MHLYVIRKYDSFFTQKKEKEKKLCKQSVQRLIDGDMHV
jgi:hypothetical protein